MVGLPAGQKENTTNLLNSGVRRRRLRQRIKQISSHIQVTNLTWRGRLGAPLRKLIDPFPALGIPRHELQQHAAQRPRIVRRRHAAARDLALGRPVRLRLADAVGADLGRARLAVVVGEAEIGNLERPSVAVGAGEPQDICRLDVPVPTFRALVRRRGWARVVDQV